jgi:5'-methylthioadenosine phosphorylase
MASPANIPHDVSVGVIGGSGVYDIEGLTDIQRVNIDTPFGSPSDEIVVGTLGGDESVAIRVAFLPRHGRGHRISPSELPARANVWAMKALGVTDLLSVSAVGSLREELRPRDIVIPDQILDRTKGVRPATFFGEGIVAHIAFAEPYCPELNETVYRAAQRVVAASNPEGAGGEGPTVHLGGTMIVMEGPQFSTKAESHFYRQIGGDIIGMTALPEAKLAREAEICYCTVAMVTDYDCWHESEEAVTVEMIVGNLLTNAELVKKIVASVVPDIAAGAEDRRCGCNEALANAILTSREAMPKEQVEKLGLLLGKYLT